MPGKPRLSVRDMKLQRWLAGALVVGLLGCAARPAEAPAPSAALAPAKPPEAAKSEPTSSYQLVQGSKRLLTTLKEPLLIDAYVAKGTPRLDQFVHDLEAVLREYERAGGGRVRVRVLQVSTPELRQQADEAGLSPQTFSESEDGSLVTQGYLGLVFRYRTEKAVIPQLPADASAGLEFWITNKIREIRDKADGIKTRIGVVSGKGELKLSDANLVPQQGGTARPTIKGIMAQAFPFYQLEELDLKGGASAIDPELAGIIVTQPQQDYVEAELRRIDEFLLLGEKSLVVYASAVNLKAADATMMASLSTHGLEKLLDGYGLHLNRDAVLDHAAQLRVQVMTQNGQPAVVRHPGIALVTSDKNEAGVRRLDSAFAGFFRMEELVFPFPSSLQILRDRQPADVRIAPVALTTAEASVETSASISMKLRDHWTPKPPLEPRIVAAYAQGRLKSAFAPRPATSAPATARASSRVLVVSSSLFLANPFAYAGNDAAKSDDPEPLLLAAPYTKHLTSTIVSFKNALDWMIGDEDLIAVSAKLVGPPRK